MYVCTHVSNSLVTLGILLCYWYIIIFDIKSYIKFLGKACVMCIVSWCMRRSFTVVCCVLQVDVVYCYTLVMWFAPCKWKPGWSNAESVFRIYCAILFTCFQKGISYKWEITERKYYNTQFYVIIFSREVCMNWRIKDQLDVTCYFILFHFLCAQHVSDINISIIRSLRLFCWITTLVYVLGSMCVGVSVWLGWSGIRVAGWSRASAHKKWNKIK